MTNHPFVSVILSGGSGTRLWPRSRKSYPKQLLKLAGDTTMLQQTASRVPGDNKVIVVCNEQHRFLVADQLSEVCSDKPDIILEPVGRNTAPAIAIAAMQAMAEGEDPVLVVLPSDHLIQNLDGFEQSLQTACTAAMDGRLVTFGIPPLGPETGYGYIHAPQAEMNSATAIKRFVEKPDMKTAREYLDAGGYYWNSGMFVFKASTYLEALAEHAADMHQAVAKVFEKLVRETDFIRLDETLFASCPADSIDYAVMEKASNTCMVPLQSDWNDIGSWSALWDIAEKDSDGNVSHGDVVAVDCHNCLFDSEHRPIAAVGVSDLVVVETRDAFMVAHRDKSQEVKKIVDKLDLAGRSEHLLHREVHRPWGTYDSIDSGATHQVKHITVKPGAQLSLQLHHQRSEHWVVVSGTARVQVGEEETTLGANESVYIPIEAMHRLTNIGEDTLHLIEVQCGDYLGEDDIVRFDDIYGRVES